MKFRILHKVGLVHRPAQHPNLRRFGVPPGGFWDPDLAQLCAAYAGADIGECLEIANGSVEIEFGSNSHLVCLGLGDGLNTIRNCTQDTRITLRATYACLCVRTGWTTERSLAPLPFDTDVLRYVAYGEPIPDEPLRVSTASSRMGIRLDGLPPGKPQELPSEPATPGIIQRTPSGQLIGLGPDGPTIGGYPKIGFVIAPDLRSLAYLKAGDSVRLKPVDFDSAKAASDDWRAFFQRRLRSV